LDSEEDAMILRMPTRLDRYPAKMVTRLADELIDRYAVGATRLLDPFCGSGAVLLSGQRNGLSVSGSDINPIAALFSKAKLNGFSPRLALALAHTLVRRARQAHDRLPVEWDARDYWFTPATLAKYESLRGAARSLCLHRSANGTAVLLAVALSVRLCSRADQRSPKPFISKQADLLRKGRHFDPYVIIPSVLEELGEIYGAQGERNSWSFTLGDIVSDATLPTRLGKHSHVITSPPYINAQDYFRNFKLELYILEGVLPFRIADIRDRFIGTERGHLVLGISEEQIGLQEALVPQLRTMAKHSARSAAVVHRYLHDMGKAFDNIRSCVEENGTLVVVCGDNLVAGQRIRTWRILARMLTERGFSLFDTFADPIGDRLLPPKRCGHKGLIKEEVILAFRLTQEGRRSSGRRRSRPEAA
jgi:hypothetical protein